MDVLFTDKIIHFVGIGGIGMSGIAEILLKNGFRVQGSDLKKSKTTERLESLGASIFIGHHADHVVGADVVVMTSACKPDNPERLYAHSHRIPVIQRAEMLAELMRLKFGIAIAGAHGKTTTTSMVGQIAQKAGLDPTVVIGGRLETFGSNALHGQGRMLIAEADESDGSFMHLNPAIAVVTNIDREHMDHYASMDVVKDTFLSFLNKVPFYGAAIVCGECPHLRSLIPRIQPRTVTYGFSSEFDLSATHVAKRTDTVGWTFDVTVNDPNQGPQQWGSFSLPIGGRHNILNVLAAIAVAHELHVPASTIKKSISELAHVERRMQFLIQTKNFWLVDDYGHHPTEIEATLQALREHSPLKGRHIVLFQPHRFTRTRDLWDEFIQCLLKTDVLYLMDIYPASESPIDKINSSHLVDDLKKRGHRDVRFVGGMKRDEVLSLIAKEVRSQDTLLTLGAGSTTEYATFLKDVLYTRDDLKGL